MCVKGEETETLIVDRVAISSLHFTFFIHSFNHGFESEHLIKIYYR